MQDTHTILLRLSPSRADIRAVRSETPTKPQILQDIEDIYKNPEVYA